MDARTPVPAPMPAPVDPTAQSPDYLRGSLFALVGPVLGVIVWVLVWKLGFIAALAGFLMAVVTAKAYEKGAGRVDRRGAYTILTLVMVGIAVSLLAVMASDLMDAVFEQDAEAKAAGPVSLLTNPQFWNVYLDTLLHDISVLQSYAADFAISIGLAFLGVFQTLREVFKSTKPQPAVPAPTEPSAK